MMKKKHDFLFLLTLVTDTFTIPNHDDFGITFDRRSMKRKTCCPLLKMNYLDIP